MKMTGFINELQSLGSQMEQETKIDAILSSLPDSFNQFVLNFNVNNMVVTLTKLRNMLQRAEDLTKKDKHIVLMFEKGKSSKPKHNKRKFGNNKSSKQNVLKKKTKKDKSEDVYHLCKKSGHWKRNCYKYLASLKKEKSSEGMNTILIIETNLLVDSSNSWCIDSGTTSHICNTLHGFQEIRKLNEGEVMLLMGIEASVSVVSIGTFTLVLHGGSVFSLKNVKLIYKL